MTRIFLIVSSLVLVACSACNKGDKAAGGQSQAGAVAAPAAFILTCSPLDTADSGTIVCFRMDTRTGEMVRIRQDRLPQSQGGGKSAAQPVGTYQLECASSSTAKKANMSCIRLNRATGDMMLVTLPKLSEFPEK